MLMTVTFLTLLSRLAYPINTLRTCVPNTQFVLNNRLCFCNNVGLWSDANCKIIERRHICQVGQVVRDGCNECVCQQSGRYVCTDRCAKEQGLSAYDPKCTPFRSYYINCSLCTCPASGVSSEAHCMKDTTCPLETKSFDFQTVKKNYCIPNVLYIFPCVECVCSENGFFVLDKCVEKCQSPAKQILRRCIPGTYYRRECDVCLCPDTSTPDENLCTRASCRNDTNQPDFVKLGDISIKCKPFNFLKPRCLFCDCKWEGTVSEDRCVEVECSKASNYHFYPDRRSCSPGEIVPNCIECFCPKNGATNALYCTSTCSYQSKLRLLEKIVKDDFVELIDSDTIKKLNDVELCDPNAIYEEDNRYCLCPESGFKSFKFCTSPKLRVEMATKKIEEKSNNATECEPGTYVDIDCNSCYCPKSGKIDKKWCTYDDCVAKKTIVAAHKSHILPVTNVNLDGKCEPGSISKVKCNFCICPDSGDLNDRACTKNNCYDEKEDQSVGMDKFTCEPLAYYEVDCNICFCPREGIKNVAKCTKNHCEKNFLRSNECIPGHLFTEGCNVCVCPPNGDKMDRACTEHNCGIAPWSLFKLSQSLFQNKVKTDKTRSLDHCFPGEEYVDECKICVCPETGLKMYANCEPTPCQVDKENLTIPDITNRLSMTDTESSDNAVSHNRVRRFELDLCMEYTVNVESERHSCTPGSMYIVRCQQCICPYMGNINKFCRPLPKSTYCEQAYPGYNFLPMGRRCDQSNVNLTNADTGTSLRKTNTSIILEVSHEHTKYQCNVTGKILDECFICSCEDGYVIEEHCFKSDAENCKEAKPSFLKDNKVDLK